MKSILKFLYGFGVPLPDPRPLSLFEMSSVETWRWSICKQKWILLSDVRK